MCRARRAVIGARLCILSCQVDCAEFLTAGPTRAQAIIADRDACQGLFHGSTAIDAS